MIRKPVGGSLVEMLVTTTIMGFIALAFMGILLMNYKTNAKVNNMQDTINAVRMIKERIGRDVREGRTLGDVFGVETTDPATGMLYVTGSDRFPEANRNPIYGAAGVTPATGWPSPPWTLSNRCLIVQIPVLDNHADSGTQHALDTTKVGWPTMIPQGWGAPAAPCNQDNVETHVYEILDDPNNPGEYVMQFSSYPGMQVPGYLPNAHRVLGQTLLTGIIGPVDGSGNPRIFQFINKTDMSGAPRDSIQPDGTHSPEYTGVIVNLEVRRHQDTRVNRRDISITPIGMKLEVFLRNNALATSTGQPSNASGVGNGSP